MGRTQSARQRGELREKFHRPAPGDAAPGETQSISPTGPRAKK
ncbi:hypothetical protein [Streptomyces sp. KL116D]